MRLFVASSFEPAFTAGLNAAAEFARVAAPRGAVRWTAPEQFHLTYAFLGETDAAGAEAARRGMAAGVSGLKPFSIELGGFGFFPSGRRPRVLWAGVTLGADRLRELAARLAAGLGAAGLKFEDRFEPHITLGRVKEDLPDGFARRLADYAPRQKPSSRVASVELMESVPGRDGNEYRRAWSCPLE